MFKVIENCNKFNDHIKLDEKMLGKNDNPSLKFQFQISHKWEDE